ncbi:hypothetical protein AB0G60_07250 [Streptomyces angustmyceticus]|uniref:DUF3558 domain-containing protein n=1 Tax=Streptomyces angustmyceticus TaxID=285578 RepID=A0A5J4L4W4_9ACTN|nr:hypothetical protein [Streptomyces angustmyceticus]GES29477.1 hypothetical protein San01_19640 [Streptomyces angustmyceticus]
MSHSGDQNNPYSQPQPHPYGQVPAPQNPVPPQQNPYAQQSIPQGQAGGYGYPAPGVPAPPPGPPAGAPVTAPGGGAGRGVSGWLWALGGVVAASAIWGSVLFATGGFSSEPSPDLAGYAYTGDLCADTSLTPFENAHFRTKANTGTTSKDANPQHSGAQLASLDTMTCNVSFDQDGTSSSGYSSTWLYSTATLHRKTDPTPEFADTYRSYEKQDTSVAYRVETVPGLGDEAYLVTRQDDASTSNSSYVILGVRDGWLTYQSTWSSYTSSSSGSTSNQPTATEVATMLKTSATETLKRLQNSRSQ